MLALLWAGDWPRGLQRSLLSNITDLTYFSPYASCIFEASFYHWRHQGKSKVKIIKTLKKKDDCDSSYSLYLAVFAERFCNVQGLGVLLLTWVVRLMQSCHKSSPWGRRMSLGWETPWWQNDSVSTDLKNLVLLEGSNGSLCTSCLRLCCTSVHDRSINEILEVACSSLVLHVVCYVYLWQTENMAVFI